MKRDLGRKPTNIESCIWASDRRGPRQSTTSPPSVEDDTKAAWALVIMRLSLSTSRSPPAGTISSSTSFDVDSSYPPPPRSDAKSAAHPNAVSDKVKPAGLYVDVDGPWEEDCPSDLSSNEVSDSPLETEFEVTTPNSISFSSPSNELRCLAKEGSSKEFSLHAAAES